MSNHHTPPGVTLGGDRNCCPGCGELFNSTFAFDMHRVGPHAGNGRRCLDVDQMRAAGMDKNRSGFWISEKRRV